jgi:hypothetical protein
MTGSDHTKQCIIIEELELLEDRLEAALEVKFDRVEDVTFARVTTADGVAPAYEITRSERVQR